MHPFTLLTLTLTIFHCYSQPQPLNDAVSLLSFKSKADPHNHLLFSPHQDYCRWQGVKCHRSRVVRFYLRDLPLEGTFSPNSLTSLPHLRVLVLSNTSLSGPLPPSFHSLHKLRSLLLPHNSFSSSLPPSLFSLSYLRVLDLSFNLLSSSLSPRFLDLPHLTYLLLQFNHFHGSLPLFNQSSLLLFNVSANNLSGRIPPSPTLSHFPASSFAFNPFLCGELLNKPCHSPSPFFASSSSSANQPSNSNVSSDNHDDSASLISPPQSKLHRKRRFMILGFSLGGLLLASSSLLLCMFIAAKKKKTTKNEVGNHSAVTSEVVTTERQGEVTRARLDSTSKEFVPEGGRQRCGDLVFCAGEVKLYTLEQLMRGSAEMLGRGMLGTTYKAKLDNQLIVTVKRLDSTRMMSGVDGDMFERVMETIGAMRHPNLVPVRAYFQAKEERLIIFDYQPNGSVFNLIHGSRSTWAKPLHWTSCLKIAEDVAQGLAFIHQASKLIHGNLKASNVLLGTEFEACVTDYCLSALCAPSSSDNNEDPDSARYRAPEARNSARNATPKIDVYAYGVFLLEILSGKPPSQHPFLAPHDMLDWVKSMRGDDDSCEDNNLAMLAEVASLCSLTSPEQRPQMWQVLKMMHKIKASVGSDYAVNPTTGYS